MATVRGMTPEAIRALLKKEIGDYQALSIAVNSAKGASDSAVAEVEKIRNDIENMDFDFDFDDSELKEAMKKFDKEMSELDKSLEEVQTEALARENKLTALEKALNQDRENFNKEMQDMARQLSESKTDLDKQLAKASKDLAANVTEVGERLSGELEKANEAISKDLAWDLSNLDRRLQTMLSEEVKIVSGDLNSKTDDLGKDLKDYKSKTDSKMGALLSEIDKAKAYAEGFLQPGNLVWNPMALDDARGITPNNTNVTIESSPSGGKDGVGALKINRTSTGSSYIYYGQPQGLEFELRPGDVVAVSAWIKSTVEVPVETLGFHVSFGSRVVYNTSKIPANAWAHISGDIPYAQRAPKTVGFRVVIDKDFPANGSVIISDPHAKRKVTSDLIVDGAVVSDKIATNAVEARNIVSGAVTAGKIAADAVEARNIASGAVTAGKIAADAVTANNILAGSIGAKHIVGKSIGADQLAANSVTSEKIVSNAVDADKIKAKSIGTDHLVANAVTTEKLASKAVKADNIDAEAVTAQKLASGAVTADKIAANSITAKHMVVAQPGNLIANGSFSNGDAGWDSALRYINSNQSTPPTGRYLVTESGQTSLDAHGTDNWFDVQPGASYAFEIWLHTTKPGSVLYIECRNQDGNHAGSAGGAINDGDMWSGGGVYLVNNRPLDNRWRRYSCVYTMDSNTTRARLGTFFFNHPNGSERDGRVAFAGVSMRPMADASLIVKGGVQADHITSGAITTDHMSANSIDGDRIKSNTLDADKIRAKSLTSDHVTFKNGFIDNAMIGNAQITSSKIKDLDAGKITTGTMSGYRIQAGTLDANRIKAGTLSADQISTGTMSGDRIQSNTLNANRIKAGTLSADQIATGTLDADRIAANSITVKELRAGTIVPIGGSLIHSEPKVSGGVPEPIWWEVCDTELAENFKGYPRPEGNPWRTYSKAQGAYQSTSPSKRLVKIKPGQKYRLQFWCKASKENTALYIEMRDQKGDHAVKSGSVTGTVNTGDYQTPSQSKEQWPVTDFSKSNSGSYLVGNFTLPTRITKVTSTIEFKEDVEYVYLANFYFNHSRGSNQGDQWLSGISLELEIPDQQAIDARQDATLDRLDSDADFLNEVLKNVARMLVRAEQNKSDATFVQKGFVGTIIYGMFGVKTGTSHIELFVTPDWVGRIYFIANLSVGLMGGTPATWMTEITSDDFKLYSASGAPSDPPSNFEHSGKFQYTKVDLRPTGSGTLEQTMLLIHHLASFNEMFRLLTTKQITRNGMLEYGRSVGKTEPSIKEPPPWENKRRLSSF